METWLSQSGLSRWVRMFNFCSCVCYRKKNTNCWFMMVFLLLLFNFNPIFGEDATENFDAPCGYDELDPNRADITHWLKSAQFYSFCLSKFGRRVHRNNGSSVLQECLKACRSTARDVLGCESQCEKNSESCRIGCRAFGFIFGRNQTYNPGIDFSLAAKQLPGRTIITATSTKIISLMWDPLFENGTDVIVYVVSTKPAKKNTIAEAPATLQAFFSTDIKSDDYHKNFTFHATTATALNVTVNQLCTIYQPKFNQEVTVIDQKFQVIPVNQHGWSPANSDSWSLASGFRAGRISGLNVVGNLSYHSDSGKLGFLKYNLTWKNRPGFEKHTRGYEISWSLGVKNKGSCPIAGVLFSRFVKKLATTATVKIHLDEKKRSCAFDLKVKPVFGCLSSETSVVEEYYTGCWILQNYQNITGCILPNNTTTGPTEIPVTGFKLGPIVKGCDAFSNSSCINGNSNNKCIKCEKEYWKITVNWTQPDVESPLIEYKCWLGYLVPNTGHAADYEDAVHKWTVPKNQTSLTFKVFKKQVYHFKVFPSTVRNRRPKLSWTSYEYKKVIDVEKVLALQQASPTDLKSKKSTKGSRDEFSIALVAAAVVLGVIAFMVLIYFHTRRSRRRRFSQANPGWICLDLPDHWEVLPSDIEIGEILGEGACGKVYVATVKGICFSSNVPMSSMPSFGVGIPKPSQNITKDMTVKAAVKMLPRLAGLQQKEDLMDEIKLMKEIGQHQHIVSMLGCVTINEPLCLIVEYMPQGDLLHFLRNMRKKTKPEDDSVFTSEKANTENSKTSGESGYQTDSPISNSNESLSSEDLLRFAWQTASGMEYLATKGFVHRDLAARNVLVGNNKTCKISDFGLTRWVYEEKMYMGAKNRKLPIKWMSIEAIFDEVFTTFSDVWAFGILLFEIVTLGGTPYPSVNNLDLLRLLRNGHRMEKPDNCSDDIYEIMQACWIEHPLERPTFLEIKNRLEELVNEGTPYVDFHVDETSLYYNVASFKSVESDTVEPCQLSDATEEKSVMDDAANEDVKDFSTLSSIQCNLNETDLKLDKIVNNNSNWTASLGKFEKEEKWKIGNHETDTESTVYFNDYVNARRMIRGHGDPSFKRGTSDASEPDSGNNEKEEDSLENSRVNKIAADDKSVIDEAVNEDTKDFSILSSIQGNLNETNNKLDRPVDGKSDWTTSLDRSERKKKWKIDKPGTDTESTVLFNEYVNARRMVRGHDNPSFKRNTSDTSEPDMENNEEEENSLDNSTVVEIAEDEMLAIDEAVNEDTKDFSTLSSIQFNSNQTNSKLDRPVDGISNWTASLDRFEKKKKWKIDEHRTDTESTVRCNDYINTRTVVRGHDNPSFKRSISDTSEPGLENNEQDENSLKNSAVNEDWAHPVFSCSIDLNEKENNKDKFVNKRNNWNASFENLRKKEGFSVLSKNIETQSTVQLNTYVNTRKLSRKQDSVLVIGSF